VDPEKESGINRGLHDWLRARGGCAVRRPIAPLDRPLGPPSTSSARASRGQHRSAGPSGHAVRRRCVTRSSRRSRRSGSGEGIRNQPRVARLAACAGWLRCATSHRPLGPPPWTAEHQLGQTFPWAAPKRRPIQSRRAQKVCDTEITEVTEKWIRRRNQESTVGCMTGCVRGVVALCDVPSPPWTAPLDRRAPARPDLPVGSTEAQAHPVTPCAEGV